VPLKVLDILDFVKWYLQDARRRYSDCRRIIAQLEKGDGIRIGRAVEIKSPERLRVGQNVSIDSGSLLHCGGMKWCNYDGHIVLGNNVYIGPNCVLFGAGGITIGDNVLISPNVVLTSHQHTYGRVSQPIREQPILFGEIRVEDNVWIGSGTAILPGVRIGIGSVVGAGAVVNRDVLPDSVVAGVPARLIKRRKIDDAD
jgi:acetyltransferase-like isoleucine patch superfamily enzyme